MLIVFTLLALAMFLYLLLANTSKWLSGDKALAWMQATLCCTALGVALLMNAPLFVLGVIVIWMLISYWQITQMP